jgi:hypothetical protein
VNRPLSDTGLEIPEHLPDLDYVLVDGAAWFTVPVGEQEASIRIRSDEGNLYLDIYRPEHEAEEPIQSLWLTAGQLEHDDAPADP